MIFLNAHAKHGHLFFCSFKTNKTATSITSCHCFYDIIRCGGLDMNVEDFVEELKTYQSPLVFNPWQDYDANCDIHSSAPKIRAANLTRYLSLRQKAHYLFIAEGLGYQGGHFTGMAMTSERILLGLHPDIKPEVVLGTWEYQRTSNPQSTKLKATQRENGFNEPTATVMWNTLARHELSSFDTILWNIFPFHPHKENDLLTNRTPSKEELDIGIEYAKKILAMVPTLKIVAIGQKSASTLERYGIECVACVPHPSMGGANRFKEAVAKLFSNGE